MDELLARFHSLQSNNLQETKRDFNELIDDIRRNVPLRADLDALIASVKPRSKLENVLKVEILIRFKKYDAMLDVLKSGSPMLIGKVLKCWKLFEVLFDTINARTLVDQIFPQTSFSTRMKIITRLSTNLKNEELADEYFRAIEDKYGLFVARGLLPACSLNLIKSTVANDKLNLTSRQLLSIFKRDREFLGYYFGVLRQAHGENFDFSGKYPRVLRYVAEVDGQMFWELFKKYKIKSKFGRHMTPRLYESGKEVVTASDYDQNLFNLRKLYEVVGNNPEDLHRLISKLLPAKADAFAGEYSSRCLKTLIGYISRNKRYEVLNACFEDAYGKSIHELLSLDTPVTILELMPVKEREVIVDKKVQSDEGLIYMYPPKKAIPLLQERIKLTSNISKRSALVEQLCKTCLINQDNEALLEVLKYLHSKHGNDRFILTNFMMSFQEWPKMEKLSGEYWTYINEFLNVCTGMLKYNLLKYNYIYNLYYHDINFLMNNVLYLVENKLPHEEFMETFLRHVKDKVGHFFGFFPRNLPDCEKLCYEHFARLLPKMYTGDEFETFACSFLVLLIHYNAHHPKHKIIISRYPPLVEALKIQITKDNYSCAEIALKYFLKFEDDGTGDQIFWDNYKKTCNSGMIIWYLRKRPHIILEHLDKILTPAIIKELRYRLHEILNLVSMLSTIREKIVSFSLNALHDDDGVVSEFAASSLSYLTTKENYFEVSRPLISLSDGKIDLKFVRKNLACRQEAVAMGLANLEDPASCLPIFEGFCIGDYTKGTSKALYRLANRVPELNLEFFLNSIYHNAALSVRKQAVNITARVSPKTTVYNFLKNCGQNNDEPPSLRSTIFKNTMWFFTGNPSEEFWNLLKENVKIVDKNDRETLGCLVDLHKIPDRYLSRYLSIAYAILSSNKHKDIQAKKYSLLASVRNETVDKLNTTSLVAVIKDTFPGAIQNTDFYLKCLFYTTGPNNTLVLDLVLNILKDYARKNYTIIRAICHKAVALKRGKDFIEKLMIYCSSAVEQGRLFEEYLLLRFTNAYLSSCSEAKGHEYGVKVSEIFEECVKLYGSSIVSIFTGQLNDFLGDLPHIASDEEFIVGFLSVNDADFNYVLALNLLFDRATWYDIQVQYGSVLTKIRGHESPTVQIYLHRRLRKAKDKRSN